jgi:hypothetical protein
MFGIPVTDHHRVPVMTVEFAHRVMRAHLECLVTVCGLKAQAKARLVEAGKMVPDSSRIPAGGEMACPDSPARPMVPPQTHRQLDNGANRTETVQDCCDRYVKVYGLNAKIRNGAILGFAGSAAHLVWMDKELGMVVRAELQRIGVRTVIMASRGIVKWFFLVTPDIATGDHIALHESLVRRVGHRIDITGPGNIILYPAPGDDRKHWVDEPVDTWRPPLSLVYQIGELAAAGRLASSR